MEIALVPAPRPPDATVRVVGSKSLTNRALLLAALADGVSHLDNCLVADDSRAMVECLRGLGVSVMLDESRRVAEVCGCGGQWPASAARLECGAAGTVARFLLAAACVGAGEYELDGGPRLRERPIAPLVDALRGLGARIESPRNAEALPLRVMARGLRGGTAFFDHAESSQFVSAILMAAPLARGDVLIELEGPLVSRPYVEMTLALLRHHGAAALGHAGRKFIVPGMQRYAPRRLAIEPDASAASYFLAAAAICGGRVCVAGLGSGTLQGDLGFVRVLERMGCGVEQSADATAVIGPRDGWLTGVDVTLVDMPDVAPTLAVAALFAAGPTRIRGVANLRVKECDRLAALAAELGKLGAAVDVHADGLTIDPPAAPRAAAIDTHDDHRMAMSFALAGLRLPGVVLRGVECVSKSYPGFFDDWRQLTG
ncbi:MAG: 3-phosphoshikimate 1-carboxyvinyltransferase [Phycisphaerae bacterium]